MSGEDVLTVDGYLAWQEINKAVLDSEIYPYLVKQQGAAIQGFLLLWILLKLLIQL